MKSLGKLKKYKGISDEKIISLLVGIVAVVAAVFNAYLLFFKGEASQTATPATSSSASANTSSSETTTATSSATTSSLKDGTYSGAVTSTNRGDYQVQITVASGKIDDITVLEYPNDNPESQSINDNALPTYTAEALSNQSAEVNQISGATEAYKGFTGSLQDALNQAQA